MTNHAGKEPTEAQVEAAAKELASYEWVNWGAVPSWVKDRYCDQARAALVAAQGAAPQLIGRLDLARHYWRSQGYDYDLHGQDGNNDYEMGLAVADAALAALAAAQGAAPQAESVHEYLLKARALHQTNSGLPSSTVDEGDLAKVIHRAACGPECTDDAPMRMDYRIARAVVEAIGGEGRGHCSLDTEGS